MANDGLNKSVAAVTVAVLLAAPPTLLQPVPAEALVLSGLRQQQEVQHEEHKQNRSLPPHDAAVPGNHHQGTNIDRIDYAVPGHRKPVQLHGLNCSQTRASSNAQSIEHHGADYSSQAHVGVCDECTDEICEKLWRCRGNSHKSCCCQILEKGKLRYSVTKFVFFSMHTPPICPGLRKYTRRRARSSRCTQWPAR